MPEYVIVCSSILDLEANNDNAHILDVQRCYDKVRAITIKYKLLLPITDRSLLDLERAIRKAFSVRKTMY